MTFYGFYYQDDLQDVAKALFLIMNEVKEGDYLKESDRS